MGEGGLVDASFGSAREEAFVFWYGAIAQLGERVLCKHEVVGSIPSGSTSLRKQLRLGARRSEHGLTTALATGSTQTSAKHHFACAVRKDVCAGFLTS